MPGFGKSLLKKSLKVWNGLNIQSFAAAYRGCQFAVYPYAKLRNLFKTQRALHARHFPVFLSFWTVSIQRQRSTKLRTFIHEHVKGAGIIPIGSMYAIYGNIYHQYTPFMLAYIPAPWILWVIYLASHGDERLREQTLGPAGCRNPIAGLERQLPCLNLGFSKILGWQKTIIYNPCFSPWYSPN